MIQTIGVVGAGVMGVGVSYAFAAASYRVCLVDITEERLAHARRALGQTIRLQRLLNQPTSAPPETVLGAVTLTCDYTALADVDFVIENVTEAWDIKRPLYATLDALCRPEVIFAANTSAISITRLASVTTRAARVVGMHFMNPVALTPMVEVIRGYHTSEETITSAQSLLTTVGKTSIVVKDAPGFVTNRVLMLMINEAIALVDERVATVAEVDQLFKGCFGHKMGPLETGDLIGLDTILLSLDVLYASFRDSKYRASPLLQQMVDAGLYGRKSGKGFYTY